MLISTKFEVDRTIRYL